MVIADLEARTPRRRQVRVRELLAKGLHLQPPAADLTHTATRPALRMRQEVHVSESYIEDKLLRERIQTVHPSLVAEFLRDRIVAGLLSYDVDIEVTTPTKGTTSAPRDTATKPTPTNETAPAAATTTSDPDPEGGDSASKFFILESERESLGPRKRSDLLGLLG